MIDHSIIPSPCFVIEERLLRNNLEIISRVKEESGATILLAFKGFAMWRVFPIIREFIQGATASSMNEARLAKEEMQTKPHTYSVAYKEEEFESLARMSSHLTFNSLSQYEKFKNQIPSTISCGIRINPEWSDVTTDLYNPASPTSRLGVTGDQLSLLPDGIDGLHFHVLCESSADALVQVLRQVELRFGKHLHAIKWINMGGGHLMTRKDYDVDLLIRTIKDFRLKHGIEVILEPGSAFVWETGFLKTTVLDIVENGGIKTAIIDASFTCHMPDCLEMPYQPRITGSSMNSENSKYDYHIGGVSCLAGDFIGSYGFDKQLEIGQPLIFEDMIHYTMVKTTMFNGIHHPDLAIWNLSDQLEILRSFGYSDYRNRMS